MPKQRVKFRDDGRRHDVTAVHIMYGPELCEALVGAAALAFADLSRDTAGKYFTTTLRFLDFVAAKFECEPSFRKVFGHLASYVGVHATVADWKFVIEGFNLEIRYGGAGIFPDTISKLSISAYLDEFIASRKRLFPEMGWPDTAAFDREQRTRGIDDKAIPSLGELYASKRKSDSHKLINDSNISLMQRLRRQCERILLEEEKKFEALTKLISQCPELEYVRFRDIASVQKPSKKFLACLDLGIEEKYMLPAALRYINEEIKPNFQSLPSATVLKRLIGFQYSLNFLKSHFEGSVDAMFAAALIIQIDTGINVQVCDSLAADPVKGVARFGKIEVHTISSVKNRANYKRIRKALVHERLDGPEQPTVNLSATPGLNRLSAIGALEIWQKLSEPIRRRYEAAHPDQTQGLWIIDTIKGGLRAGFAMWEWEGFRRRFERGDRRLSGLGITRRHIRPTYFQIQFLKSSGDADLVAGLANHSSTQITLNTYLAKPHLRRVLDSYIHDFQAQFESLFGQARYRAAQLFLSQHEFNITRAKAVENGLGFWCADPKRGIQPGTTGRDCAKLDACASCPLLEFQPTERSVFQLLWFKASLDAAEDTFISQNPERWVRVWLPAQALCMAVTELLAQGPSRKFLLLSQKALDDRQASGGFEYFKPW